MFFGFLAVGLWILGAFVVSCPVRESGFFTQLNDIKGLLVRKKYLKSFRKSLEMGIVRVPLKERPKNSGVEAKEVERKAREGTSSPDLEKGGADGLGLDEGSEDEGSEYGESEDEEAEDEKSEYGDSEAGDINPDEDLRNEASSRQSRESERSVPSSAHSDRISESSTYVEAAHRSDTIAGSNGRSLTDSY